DSLSAGSEVDPHSADFVASVRHWVDQQLDQIVGELEQLATYQSLAFEGFARTPLEDSAQAVAELFDEVGMQQVQGLTERGGDEWLSAPCIIGRRPSADNKPTVLLYAHHDVQPVGDMDAWESDPWIATERDGRLYGRGTADDKAGIVVHRAAIQALDDLLGADHGLGLTVFIEGEEEVGSPFFTQFLDNHRNLLQADTIIVADSANWSVEVPALT